jgi:hypothetical protein
LALTRESEVYLKTLEHYIYQAPISFDDKDEMLRFLRLYQAETKKGISETLSILQVALDRHRRSED